MFYSHEILTSQAYGVATVWLVSTLGLKSSTRKISRKAIQEVDVQKACETILQPGAPIALRLQGSLLYGVSRVYLQQCQYVLTDAERVQAHMRAFYRALGGSDNALDPQAGRSKRKDLILEDDPEFDPNPDLPAFHFDDDGNLIIPQISQTSRKTSSQLSPLQPDGSFSGSNRSILGGFDLSQSPFGGGGIITEPFGAGTMTPGKEGENLMLFGDEERELQALDDWGIEIDAEGNIVPAMEEPQLPRLPQPDQEEDAGAIQLDELIQIDDQGDLIMAGAGGGNVFHSDPPLPAQQERQQQEAQEKQHRRAQEEQEVAVEDEVSSGQAPVRAQRKRRRPIFTPDEQTKITRQELKAWSADYLDNAEQASQPRLSVTLTEARKNAFDLVFGRGIAGVGFPTGVPGFPHPLASHFAGDGLQARLLGIVIAHPGDGSLERPRGRRRSAFEALDLEQDDAERRVRRRLSDEEEEDFEHAQNLLPQHGDDALPLPGDDELPPVEVGRRAGSALPDVSSDVPWNRPSSQVPSSSVKGAGAGSRPPSRQVSASPLHGRGALLPPIPGPEIERFSDNNDDAQQRLLDSDGFAPLHSGPAGSFGSGSHPSNPFQDLVMGGYQTASRRMRAALDREGRNFLAYVEAAAREKGSPDDSDSRKRWVPFEALFQAEDQTRAVVAQAFYHVLSLATKNVIEVRQDGQGGNVAFGPIRLGVEAPPPDAVEDAEAMEGVVEGVEH